MHGGRRRICFQSAGKWATMVGSELPVPRSVRAGCGSINLIDIYWCLQCARLCSRHEKSNGEHIGQPAHVQELTVWLANL